MYVFIFIYSASTTTMAMTALNVFAQSRLELEMVCVTQSFIRWLPLCVTSQIRRIRDNNHSHFRCVVRTLLLCCMLSDGRRRRCRVYRIRRTYTFTCENENGNCCFSFCTQNQLNESIPATKRKNFIVF